jgi:hypothetical protein
MWTARDEQAPFLLFTTNSSSRARGCPQLEILELHQSQGWLSRMVPLGLMSAIVSESRSTISLAHLGSHGVEGPDGSSFRTNTVVATGRTNGETPRKSPFSIRERSGQLRPYVRPVVRRSPLAIMGVRLRVRHQSGGRARGTYSQTVLPELLT